MSTSLRIAVVSDFPLGSHRAHAINVVKTAGGFARLGHDTLLVCRAPDAEHAGTSIEAVLAQYGEPELRVEFVPATLPAGPSIAPEFARLAIERATRRGCDLVYARHFEAATQAAACGLPTILETHSHVGDERPEVRRALAATRHPTHPLTLISTISPFLRDNYVARGADPARVAIVPDGVDLDLFAPRPEVARSSPFAAWNTPAIVYAGHLYDYKGVPTILRAARAKPHYTWHLVGGAPEDIASVRTRVEQEKLRNVVLHGLVDHASVPPYLWHADVLLLPPSADHASALWTSPVKLGEYLASERPIVASRIAGLTHWVSEPAVRWFEPDEHESLNQAVDRALAESPGERSIRIAAARARATELSYPCRARAMLDAADRAGTPHPLVKA